MSTSCPNNPPPPDGFRIWRDPVPQPLADWAIYLLSAEAPRAPYGTTWGLDYTLPGTTNSSRVIARKDRHTWTYRGGKLVTGLCIFGITLFQSVPMTALASYNSADDSLDTPDPNAAVYTADAQGPSWGLVFASGAAGVGVVTLFLLALKGAGKASKTARR
jgi:hypothetical protein